MVKKEDNRMWETLCEAERSFIAYRMKFVREVEDPVPVLREAISSVESRGCALRILLLLSESVRRCLLPELIECAAAAHGDLRLCRDVIASIDMNWLKHEITPLVDSHLSAGDEETYRRFAELYQRLDPSLLSALCQNALRSDEPTIREVGEDFICGDPD